MRALGAWWAITWAVCYLADQGFGGWWTMTLVFVASVYASEVVFSRQE
jgi:hypothetical protein